MMNKKHFVSLLFLCIGVIAPTALLADGAGAFGAGLLGFGVGSMIGTAASRPTYYYEDDYYDSRPYYRDGHSRRYVRDGRHYDRKDARALDAKQERIENLEDRNEELSEKLAAK